MSKALERYNNRKKLWCEQDRSPRVQLFKWDINYLADYFSDLDPYVVKGKLGFKEIDEAAVSSKSPALMLTWEDYLLFHDIIQTHRSLFSHILLANCTAENALEPYLQKLQLR